LFVLRTPEGEVRARAVIIATGAYHRKLGVPGEEELSGKGISYCATCDGFLLQGKDVIVVGGVTPPYSMHLPQQHWLQGKGGP